jgi:ribonuclease-3 family protein
MDDMALSLHPRALAHLGDSVYELWVREKAIAHHQQSKALHQFTTQRVNAHIQALLLEQLRPRLSEVEQEIVRRAQNMPVPTGRRNEQSTYRKATALEALVGYWYLTDRECLSRHRDVVLDLLAQLIL